MTKIRKFVIKFPKEINYSKSLKWKWPKWKIEGVEALSKPLWLISDLKLMFISTF